ncbi:MAG TPA: TetR/AcrR family transcriptional regulator [Firmicutes bacterium]|nr:TetR/AcrR family transcriptional regulator [Bacillota bacterium]
MDYAEQRRQQGRETERRLMQAAWELMSEQGFDAVSVREICRAAGVTTGAFYHHFSGKEALLNRGYERMDAYIRRRVEEHPAPRAVDNLQTIFLSYAAFLEEESGGLTARFYQNLLSTRSTEMFDRSRFIYNDVEKYIRLAIEQGDVTGEYSPACLASFCVRHFRGIAIDWAFQQYAYSLGTQMREEFLFLQRLLRP